MCYWDIIQMSCQDHLKVTQGHNGKKNINIHFLAFLSYFSPADIYAYYAIEGFKRSILSSCKGKHDIYHTKRGFLEM